MGDFIEDDRISTPAEAAAASMLREQRMRIAYDYGQGKLLKADEVFPTVSKSQYHNVLVTFLTSGKRAWHHHYSFPEFGVNFMYSNIGNDTILGNMYSIVPVWILQIWEPKKFGLMIKLGMSFAYFDKKYHPVHNPDNSVISSSFSNYTCVGLYARYRIFPKLVSYAGVTAVHSSNGHTYIPNASLNDFPWTIGLQYRTTKYTKPQKIVKQFNSIPWIFNLRTGLGVNEPAGSIVPSRGPKQLIYALAPFVSKQVSHKNDIHIGMYILYFQGYYDFMKYWDYFKNKEIINSFVGSIFGGHEFILGKKWGFVSELNLNFYNPFFHKIQIEERPQANFFTYGMKYLGARIGFQYYVLKGNEHIYNKNNISIGLFIKSLMMQADYVEVNIGYGF
ncbi:MAG: acyloxyacyl hydrolase, partial [Bacteroidales bacterium]